MKRESFEHLRAGHEVDADLLNDYEFMDRFLDELTSETRLTSIPWVDERETADQKTILLRLTRIKAILPEKNNLVLADTHNKTLENYVKLALETAGTITNLLSFLQILETVIEAEHLDETSSFLAQQVFHIWSPAAEVAGLYGIKESLEKCAFKAQFPIEHEEIVRAYGELGGDEVAKNFLQDETEGLEAALAESIDPVAKLKIGSRRKSYYSVWRKVTEDKRPGYVLTDFFGIRIIVGATDELLATEQCHHIADQLSKLYEEVFVRRKDYISSPKPNGYRSIHQTMTLPDGTLLEIQIRTESMHDSAEHDSNMSHIGYDARKLTPGRNPSAHVKKPLHRIYSWRDTFARRIAESDGKTSGLAEGAILVFNDDGNLFELRSGETALDCAFRIHSDHASKTREIWVNGKLVRFGDKVSHGSNIRLVYAQAPTWKDGWLTLTTCKQAKEWLVRGIKKRDSSILIKKGISRVAEALLEHGINESLGSLDPEVADAIVYKYRYKDLATLLRDIGYDPKHRALGTIIHHLREASKRA